MADQDHAPLAPSSAARIVACTGSRKLAALYPEPETIETREGTASHWAGAELLAGRDVDTGQVAANGVTLTDEMIEGAEMFAEHIRSRGAYEWELVEHTLPAGSLHADNWGTPDFVGMQPMHLFVDDYKFGHGYVEVFENWQLMNYVCLLLDFMGVNGQVDQMMRVTMTIVQPRNYHRDGPVRSWSVMACDLRGYFNKMRAAYEQAMRDDAPCTVNAECEHCPARHACEAATAAGYSAVKHAYSSVPLVMSAPALGLELRTLRRAAKMLKARITGLEEQVLSTIVRGVDVPYFSVSHGVGRTVWTAPATEVIALGQMLGVDVSKPDVITPKQSIKAGLPAEVVAAYSHAPRGAAELTEDNGHAAAKVFK